VFEDAINAARGHCDDLKKEIQALLTELPQLQAAAKDAASKKGAIADP